MRISYNKYRRFFSAPPTESSGGSLGNPNAQQGGQTEETKPDDNDFFKGINLDDLDPETRKVLEDGKKKVAALQLSEEKAKQVAIQLDQQRRADQSRFDKLNSEINRAVRGESTQVDISPAEAARIALKNKMATVMKKRGVNAEHIDSQAEMMADILGEFAAGLREEIGADLRPLAATVLSREAKSAYMDAMDSDELGILEIKEVKENVEAQLETMTAQGNRINKATVENLASMAYVNHLRAGGAPASTTKPTEMNELPSMGRTAGNGGAPQRRTQPVTTGHILDTDTRSALNLAMDGWTVKPKGYQAQDRRGNRK